MNTFNISARRCDVTSVFKKESVLTAVPSFSSFLQVNNNKSLLAVAFTIC